MLFKRFILVTALIAISGIALLQVIAHTKPNHSDFEVGQRLIEWKAYDARRACQNDQHQKAQNKCVGGITQKHRGSTS